MSSDVNIQEKTSMDCPTIELEILPLFNGPKLLQTVDRILFQINALGVVTM